MIPLIIEEQDRTSKENQHLIAGENLTYQRFSQKRLNHRLHHLVTNYVPGKPLKSIVGIAYNMTDLHKLKRLKPCKDPDAPPTLTAQGQLTGSDDEVATQILHVDDNLENVEPVITAPQFSDQLSTGPIRRGRKRKFRLRLLPESQQALPERT